MIRIPLARPFLDSCEMQAVSDVIGTGWITQGPRVEEFEKRFAIYTGAPYAVAVANCTAALHLSLIVAGVEKGDEVICPSLSFIATANAIVHAGGTPVFSDVDPATLNLDPADAVRRISRKTKVILLVHQLGMPADIAAFQTLCRNSRITLIEDAACAIGSAFQGMRIGVHSDLVCFSFHPRKVISTGEGGMITTRSEDLFLRLKRLRHQGMSIDDRTRHLSETPLSEEYPEIGYNHRMTDLQAAIGIVQLEKLNDILKGRRRIAHRYLEELGSIPYVTFQTEREGCISNYQSFVLCLTEDSPVSRNELMSRLLKEGIATRRGVMAIHREQPYRTAIGSDSLPVTEAIADRSLVIPIFIPMQDQEINHVTSAIKRIFADHL